MDMTVAVAIVGAAGTVSAALITAWFTRRQASRSAHTGELLWERDKRHAACSAFLANVASARNEISEIWRDFKTARLDQQTYKVAEEKISSAGSSVHEMRLSCAEVFTLGPQELLSIARRIEECVVVYYECIKRLNRTGEISATYVTSGDEASSRSQRTAYGLAFCGELDTQIRQLSDRFASAARSLLSDDEVIATESPARADSELVSRISDSLVNTISSATGLAPGEIDTNLKVWETGIDSMGLIQIINKLSSEYGLDETAPYNTSLILYQLSIESAAELFANQATRDGAT